ncbi:Na+/H+ antiporter NhaC [Virgibacillus phasianinus]|uniref:Na+/H+ antiporter NhaC n=1 Tax=Virgibacillus phasianinus TaxID=2017483 RepID=A0A220U3A8_9BACI|nr:Na+/H+ antiporter NhaC [Virgibacillus phasianinus]ASK62629.1 Na+/H+ antiporter NhaC [Virgibacillus phasianinus]
MYRIKAVQKPSLIEALAVTIAVLIVISFGIIYFEAAPHIPLVLALLLLVVYGLMKRITYQTLEEGITEGAKAGMGAVFLFFFIGILIASWMIGGTIPSLIYGGFELVTPHFFLAIVFVVTAVVGLCVGSSLTTVATAGLAFIGIATAADVSLAVTAGAIVSGAFFGDKMSPLSDTTNMASSILKVDLFEHIRNMSWTTVPAFMITLIIFAIISPEITSASFADMEKFQQGLLDTGLVTWYNGLIPVVVLLIFSIMKIPALLTLASGAASAVVMAYINGFIPLKDLLGVLFGGYVSETGVEEIDALLTRGGLISMMFTIGIVLLALSLGGLLFKLGIVPRLLESIESMLKKAGSVIAAAAFTAIGINVLIGEQYLSILLTGEAYQSRFARVGLANKNLSRVAEDAGTVVNPLVPWSVCGAFITSTLGVSTLAYFPFAFFCLLSPILTILFGFTGKTLTYIDKSSSQA